MAKPVKKKKRQAEIQELVDPKAQRKADRAVRNYVDELDDKSAEREKYVAAILAANDDDVWQAVKAMVEMLTNMHGDPKLVYKGHAYNPSESELQTLKRVQKRNFRYMAIRVLVACAEWDIQIAGFTAPKKLCVRCAAPVKSKKKGKKKRG